MTQEMWKANSSKEKIDFQLQLDTHTHTAIALAALPLTLLYYLHDADEERAGRNAGKPIHKQEFQSSIGMLLHLTLLF
jgi:hypothetical protein